MYIKNYIVIYIYITSMTSSNNLQHAPTHGLQVIDGQLAIQPLLISYRLVLTTQCGYSNK